ncbi:laccase-5-like isoform X2 [Chrysoperla carnea]|nr:laccase-5-like isoform X2 [Chrysoperla carnea]
MICRVKFDIEFYQTLSSEEQCLSCPSNATTDCLDNDQCITTNGAVRPIITANRKLPGPAIHVCQNDLLVIDVTNKLPGQSISIHWRGQTQVETPFMDGVTMISQCPLTSYTRFQYKFRANVAGTHFWEAYSKMNAMNGLFGALIVRQPENLTPHRKLYDIDSNEHVLMISGWNNQFLIQNFYQKVDEIDSLLINGKTKTEIQVESNKRYRFRIAYVTSSILCPIQLTINKHILKVIALDGHPTTPTDVASVILNRGERLDFVLTTNQLSDKYLLNVETVNCDMASDPVNASVIINYINNEKFTDIDFKTNYIEQSNIAFNNQILTMDNYCENVNENICVDTIHSLQSLPSDLQVLNVSQKLFLGFGVTSMNSGILGGRIGLMHINNISFTFPSSPLVLQNAYPDSMSKCTQSNLPSQCLGLNYCECTHIEQIPLGSTVELIIIDHAGDLDRHIYHMHGYSFWVVGARQFSTMVSLEEIKELDHRGMLFTRNLINPSRKDTITIPKYGVVALRFKADSPGYWILREEHNMDWTRGADVILQVGNQVEFVRTPSDFPRCGDFIGPEFFLA